MSAVTPADVESAAKRAEKSMAERDSLIVRAWHTWPNVTLRQLAHHARISHAQVRNILLRDDPTYPRPGKA